MSMPVMFADKSAPIIILHNIMICVDALVMRRVCLYSSRQ